MMALPSLRCFSAAFVRKHRENIGAEGAFQLLGADVRDTFLRMLFSSVIYQDMSLPNSLLVVQPADKTFVANVSSDRYCTLTLFFHHLLRLFSIVVFVQVQSLH